MTSVTPEKAAAPGKKPWKDLARLVVVALFFVVIALLLKNPYIRSQIFDIENIRREMDGGGWMSIAAFVGIAAFVNAIGIPRLWICAVAGSIFGAVQGGALGLLSTLLGSSLNFLAGRSLLRGPIKRHIPRRLRHWYTAFNDHGFRAILYLRLFPFTNATLTNLLGGASRMKYRDYLLATAIGYLPFTIAFATLGSSAAKQNGWQLALGLGLFAAVALGQWLWSQRCRARRVDALKNHEVAQPELSTAKGS